MRLLALFLLAALSVFTFAPGAGAQGFQVRPLVVDGEVPPGTDVLIPIEVTPTSQLEGRTLDVEVVQLGHAETGGFIAIPYEPGSELPRSAASWITAPSEVLLEPRETTVLEVGMRVPLAARGTHAAALLLSAPPPEGAEGLRLTLRVLIPIILGTEGRPARQDVRLADAQLRYRLPEPDTPGSLPDPDSFPETTLVDALIENNGGTFSSLRGDVWVDAKDDSGEWRQIRRAEIPATRLLPESAISMPVDLGRLLPTGEYRIRGELYVDGRRTRPLRREVAFEGHPEVQALVTDIDLGVEPAVFEYDYRPGAARSGRIAVTNPAIDPVEVTVEVAIPDEMAGRASATVRDTDLSAAGWIEVQPAQFVLRPGQTRNLRLLARFPDSAPRQQNYYAQLTLSAAYLDGQRAGSATGLVEVARAGGEDRRELALEAVRVATTETQGDVALGLRATNVGNVLLRPEVEFRVLDAGGREIVSGPLTSEIAGPLMPLAARTFGGTLSVSELPEGELTLLTIVRDGGVEVGEVVQQLGKAEDGSLTLETRR